MKIANLQVVTSFEIDASIVLSCGPVLKALEAKISGRIVNLNVPDQAPPTLARIILQSPAGVLGIALNQFHFTLVPQPSMATDFRSVVEFGQNTTIKILNDLIGVMPPYRWTGIIAALQFPEESKSSQSAAEAATPAFDRLVQIDTKNRPLSSFQLQFGVKEDGFFSTYTISGFETRQLKITPDPTKRHLEIDASTLPLTECGIGVTVDINNKAASNIQDPISDIKSIFQRVVEKGTNLAKDLNLDGVIG